MTQTRHNENKHRCKYLLSGEIHQGSIHHFVVNNNHAQQVITKPPGSARHQQIQFAPREASVHSIACYEKEQSANRAIIVTTEIGSHRAAKRSLWVSAGDSGKNKVSDLLNLLSFCLHKHSTCRGKFFVSHHGSLFELVGRFSLM